jgi:hypothetical protein
MEKHCAFFEVENKFLNVNNTNFVLQKANEELVFMNSSISLQAKR